MRCYRFYSVALLLVLTTACSSLTASDSSPLDGVWAAPVEILTQHAGVGVPPRAVGTAHMWFSFAKGSFLSERHVIGGYEGEPIDQLSQIEQLEGTFWTDGDRITIETDRIITWKVRSDGTYAAPTVTRYRYHIYDDATFALNNSQLLLQWISYPADGPELTEMILTRSAQEMHSLRPVILGQRPRLLW